VYYILAQLTNSNVLGKSPVRDSNNREMEIAIGGFGKNTIHTWRWNDQIYEYTLTNIIMSYIVILMLGYDKCNLESAYDFKVVRSDVKVC
jgi:hypothetical protein